MNDFDIDARIVKEKCNLIINNPVYKKKHEINKERTMIFLNEQYRKNRDFLSKLFKESESEKLMLDSFDKNNYYQFRKDRDINGLGADENKQKRYYLLEYINIVEMFPKENIEYLKYGLDKFSKKHTTNSSIGKYYEEKGFSNVQNFRDTDFNVCVASFGIKEESRLKTYVDAIEIRMRGLSATLGILNFKLHINNEIAKVISEICIGNMEQYRYVHYMSDKKLYQYRLLGCGSIPGGRYKNKIKTIIEDEIKWNVLNELRKYLSMPIFSSTSKNKSLLVYKTNIDGNDSRNFWNSVGVNNEFCDYFKNFSGCISWENEFSNSIAVVYRPKKNDCSDIYSHDIEEYYEKYMITQSILEMLREKLSEYTRVAAYIANNKGSIREWLQLKQRMENELIIAKRFLKEIRKCNFEFESEFRCLPKRNCSFTKEIFENQKGIIDECTSTLESISDIINANLESLTSVSNYNLQKTTLITNAFSAVFALIAIIISLSIMDPIIKILSQSYNLLSENYKSALWIVIICILLIIGIVIICSCVRKIMKRKYMRK